MSDQASDLISKVSEKVDALARDFAKYKEDCEADRARLTANDILKSVSQKVDDLASDFAKYKHECSDDRTKLTGRYDALNAQVVRVGEKLSSIEEKTDAQTPMIAEIQKSVKSALNNPSIKAGVLALILATLGYLTWFVQSHTGGTSNAQQVRVLNPSASSIIVIEKP